MKRNILGGDGPAVSALGIGCWSFGGGEYWGPTDQKETDRVVHGALDLGINYFDTAEAYNAGASETALGAALKGRRDKAVVGTKVSTSNCRPGILREHCRASLKRLGTDHIDLYMLHWPVNRKAMAHFSKDPAVLETVPAPEEVFGELATLKKEGLVRHLGVSNHGLLQMKAALAAGVGIIANELPYNLISRAIEEEILPYCVKSGIGVIAYMALQQGVLAGMYPDPKSVPPAQAHSRHFHFSRGGDQSRHGEEGAEAEVFSLIGRMRGLAAELGISLPALSLSWAMANKGITCSLVGVRSPAKLKENVEAASYILPEDAKSTLDRWSLPILEKLGYNPDYYENRNSGRVN
jgi:aryl-alcohol dehydrogenase-like predicted oxidoreductase